MTAFADLIGREDVGLWLGVEISVDDFATVSYRWATHAGTVNSNFFECRIKDWTPVQRGFGPDHLPASATMQLVLDNTDFGADAIADRGGWGTITQRARFKVLFGLTDPDTANVNQATVRTQQLGIFACLTPPRRDAAAVYLSLSDDSMAKYNDMLRPPSLKDWLADGGTNAGNCVFYGQDLVPNDEPQNPMPLQFGVPPYVCKPLGSSYQTPLNTAFAPWTTPPIGDERRNIMPLVVCATRDSATVTANDGYAVSVRFAEAVVPMPPSGGVAAQNTPHPMAGQVIGIPKTFAFPSGGTGQIWEAYKTQTITIDGYDWKILWIAFNVFEYWNWWTVSFGFAGGQVPTPPIGADFAGSVLQIALGGTDISPPLRDALWSAFESFHVLSAPGSEITNKANPGDMGNPTDILQDLYAYYSSGGTAAIDTVRFARAKLATRVKAKGYVAPANFQKVARSGEVQQQIDNLTPFGIGLLRKVAAEVCGSCDLDVFVTMEGKVACVAQGADFETQTTAYPEIPEEKLANVSDTHPKAGDRWAEYNRVYVVHPSGQQLGPFDNPFGIAQMGIIVTRVLPGKWWADLYEAKRLQLIDYDHSLVWQLRNLETKARPLIAFRTDTIAITLELGDYFIVNWTRGGNSAAYTNTLFKLESASIAKDGSMNVVAVWMGDLQTDKPYILDDEDMIVRTAPAFGQTLSINDSVSTFTRSGGSFVTDGVQPGDIVQLRDATEGATEFWRNRDLRVASVTDATHLVVTGVLFFGGGGPYTIADTDWQIVRGATTAHTSSSDPVNYPSGGQMYGKVTDASGQFSNTLEGNKLLDG